MVAYILFAIAGFAFGYIIPGRWAFLPVLFPILLAIPTAMSDGVEGHLVFRLILALVITVVAVIAGRMVAHRRDDAPQRSEDAAATS